MFMSFNKIGKTCPFSRKNDKKSRKSDKLYNLANVSLKNLW